MKKHQMKLSHIPYIKIANGEKVIESRLYDDKRKLIQVGDEIEFTSVDTGESTITIVEGLYIYIFSFQKFI